MVRKSTIEMYARESDNLILSSTFNEIIANGMIADMELLGGLAYHSIQTEIAHGRERKNLPLSERQKILADHHSQAAAKLLNKSVINGVVFALAVGITGTYLATRTEREQISRLEAMNDNEKVTEYQTVLGQINEINKTLNALAAQ